MLKSHLTSLTKITVILLTSLSFGYGADFLVANVPDEYATIQAAETALDGNIVGQGGDTVIQITGQANGNTQFRGWTTDLDNRVVLRAISTDTHSGTVASGAKLFANEEHIIFMNNTDARGDFVIRDLIFQLAAEDVGNASAIRFNTLSNSNTILVERCIFFSTTTQSIGFYSSSTQWSFEVKNSIFYGFDETSFGAVRVLFGTAKF